MPLICSLPTPLRGTTEASVAHAAENSLECSLGSLWVPSYLQLYFSADRMKAKETGIVPISSATRHAARNSFFSLGTAEELSQLVYCVVADCHLGCYLESDMHAFRDRTKRYPDCGYVSGALCDVLQVAAPHIKATPLQLVADATRKNVFHAQFVTLVRAGPLIYAVDQAAWYYGGTQQHFVVLPADDISTALSNTLAYLNSNTAVEHLVPKSWRTRFPWEETIAMLKHSLS